jgi:predicted Fe-Mo cluster-binding NifX family protein
MKIVVSASGPGLDAPASPVFGRCPTYVFVDVDSLEVESIENPAVSAAGGAGIQAAQFVVERGAQAVVSGNVGPNAFGVLQSAGVPVYLFNEAVKAYKKGQLSTAGQANVRAHAGMGNDRGAGRAAPQKLPASSASSREEEIASLKDIAGGLREQLANLMERLDRLEKEV